MNNEFIMDVVVPAALTTCFVEMIGGQQSFTTLAAISSLTYGALEHYLKKEGITCLKQMLEELKELAKIAKLEDIPTSATGGSYACGQASREVWEKQEKREMIQALA